MTLKAVANVIKLAGKKGLSGDEAMEFIKSRGVKQWEINKLLKAGNARYAKYNTKMPWKVRQARNVFEDAWDKAQHAQKMYQMDFHKMDLQRVEEWREEELRRFGEMYHSREDELRPLIMHVMNVLRVMPLKRLAGVVILMDAGTMASPLKEHIDSLFILGAGASDLLAYVSQYYSVRSNQYRRLVTLANGMPEGD